MKRFCFAQTLRGVALSAKPRVSTKNKIGKKIQTRRVDVVRTSSDLSVTHDKLNLPKKVRHVRNAHISIRVYNNPLPHLGRLWWSVVVQKEAGEMTLNIDVHGFRSRPRPRLLLLEAWFSAPPSRGDMILLFALAHRRSSTYSSRLDQRGVREARTDGGGGGHCRCSSHHSRFRATVLHKRLLVNPRSSPIFRHSTSAHRSGRNKRAPAGEPRWLAYRVSNNRTECDLPRQTPS